MPETPNDRQRFSDLLPGYVNGSISQEDREWVVSHMASHPESNHQLRFIELIRDVTVHPVSPVSMDEGADRLIRDWKLVRNPPSLWHKVQGWLQVPLDFLGRAISVPAPALTVLALLVVGQAAFLGNIAWNESQQAQYRGQSAECINQPLIKVVFKSEVKYLEVLLLLRSQEAKLSSGPSETGEIWLNVPAGRSLDEALAALRSNSLVDEAVIVQGGRTMPGCKP